MDHASSGSPSPIDMAGVLKMEKLKEELKMSLSPRSAAAEEEGGDGGGGGEALMGARLSAWSSARDIVIRKKEKKLEAFAPNLLQKEMPDFDRIPLPPYEPFKIFRETRIGVGEKSLNQLRVEKYLDTTKYKQLAKDNMPFMALQIHGLQEVEISPDLPHSENMLVRGIRVRNLDDLMEASLDFRTPATGGPGGGGGGGAGGGPDRDSTSSRSSKNSTPDRLRPERRASLHKGAEKSLSPISEPTIDEDEEK